MTSSARRGLWFAVATLGGCSPALDWRDAHLPDTTVQLQFPCRPAGHERQLNLAGAPVALALHACSAGGQTWGLGFADVGDPARVAAALTELRSAAVANVAGGAALPLPLQVAGATPNPNAARVRLAGRLPDGRNVQMQVAVFARGTQVYQATVLGEQLPDEAANNFFASLRFTP